jgi:hypothetical protein
LAAVMVDRSVMVNVCRKYTVMGLLAGKGPNPTSVTMSPSP